MKISRFKLFMKRSIVLSGLKPSYLLSAFNNCLHLGQWIRNNPEPLVLKTREDMYRHLNDAILKNGPIDYLEFGVFRGASLRLWCELNKDPKSRFFGFDSFIGFTEEWQAVGRRLGPNSFDLKGKALEIDDSRATVVPGYFHDTLRPFLKTFTPGNRLVIHVDCDIYSSTLCVLTNIAEILKPGSILIFDEFNLASHEFRAFQDFVSAFVVKYRVLGTAGGFYECVAVEVL